MTLHISAYNLHTFSLGRLQTPQGKNVTGAARLRLNKAWLYPHLVSSSYIEI
jgi:hypothetical protein